MNRIFSGFRSIIQNAITTGMITTHATIQRDLSLNRFAIIHTPIALTVAMPATIAERVCVSHTAQRLIPAIARPGIIDRREEKAVPADRNTMKMPYAPMLLMLGIAGLPQRIDCMTWSTSPPVVAA